MLYIEIIFPDKFDPRQRKGNISKACAIQQKLDNIAHDAYQGQLHRYVEEHFQNITKLAKNYKSCCFNGVWQDGENYTRPV